MTAPGQEPDEVMTATPGGHDDSDQPDSSDASDRPDSRDDAERPAASGDADVDGADHTGDPVTDEAAPPAREPDLGRVGDNHMPQDLREAERAAGARSRERAAEDRDGVRESDQGSAD